MFISFLRVNNKNSNNNKKNSNNSVNNNNYNAYKMYFFLKLFYKYLENNLYNCLNF